MRRLAQGLLCAALLLLGGAAHAQVRGFQMNRYEPTASGSWFFAVERPYYSSQRLLAAGLNLTYAHNPLRYGESDTALRGLENVRGIVSHQIISHFDVALALRDRVLLNLSLPLVLFEQGQPTFGIAPVSPLAISDPRLSATVRIYGQPDKDRWSAHATLAFWLPLRAMNGDLPQQSSDASARLRATAILAGKFRSILWTGTFAFMYRPDSRLGDGLAQPGASAGAEVQLGLAAGYHLPAQRLVVGPELMLATSVIPSEAFRSPYTNLELLLGAQHNVAKLVQVGLALGVGLLSAPGTPDFRMIFRVAYAPVTRDRDQDGIADDTDACPDQKGVRSDVPSNNGCPPIPDLDCDGIPDAEDECPDVPEGRRPDPTRIGCPFTGVSTGAPVELRQSRPESPPRPPSGADADYEPPPAGAEPRQ